MGVSDGLEIIRWKGAVLGVNVEHPVVTSGIFCVRCVDRLFPNDWGGLVISFTGSSYIFGFHLWSFH